MIPIPRGTRTLPDQEIDPTLAATLASLPKVAGCVPFVWTTLPAQLWEVPQCCRHTICPTPLQSLGDALSTTPLLGPVTGT